MKLVVCTASTDLKTDEACKIVSALLFGGPSERFFWGVGGIGVGSENRPFLGARGIWFKAGESAESDKCLLAMEGEFATLDGESVIVVLN